jgi:folate-binding protein YgfZ
VTVDARSPLTEELAEAGAVFGPYHDGDVARHFGDPGAEYAAAVTRAAVFDRGHRVRLRVSGRAPTQMLSGVLTGVMPPAPIDAEDGVFEGRASYHAVLTPKGRMISDLVALRIEEEEVLLLDVPVAGAGPLREHLGRVLPPRFARIEDVSSTVASISVVGREAGASLARLALGLRVDASWFEACDEGMWRRVGGSDEGLLVMRTEEVWPPAWTVYGRADAVRALWRAVTSAGARPAGLGVWSTLRLEAGRPAFGTDMDDRTLPPEAGIVARAIDETKGCYTGQEVIVRIRDRGHVNRHLRRLELGDVPAPAPGAELLAVDGSDKVVGEVTSSVQSPEFGGVLAFAYVRRGVSRVRLGSLEVDVPSDFPGPPAR